MIFMGNNSLDFHPEYVYGKQILVPTCATIYGVDSCEHGFISKKKTYVWVYSANFRSH